MENQHQQIWYMKDKLTEQLNRRHQERQANLNNIHELRRLETERTEGADYFSSVFNQNVREIEQNLTNIEPGDVTTLALVFSQLENKLQELQRYLSTSAYFLPNYNVRQCQSIIGELTNRMETLKMTLIPKKKFGFKSRTRPNAPTHGNCNGKGLGKEIVCSITQVDSNKIEEKATDTSDKLKNIVGEEQKTRPDGLFEWTVYSRTNEVLQMRGNEVNNKDITVSKLDNCLLEIYGHPGSLQLNDISNSTIVCGPIARSVFAANCVNCIFVFACQQLRLHTSKNCEIYLHVTTRAIIEDATKISVAPFNLTYPDLGIDFLKAGLSETENNWDDVADFNWLATEIKSPNWSVLPENERTMNWNAFLTNIRNRLK